MNTLRRYKLVLAIYPNTSGFAFVLFEGSLSPVDWGVTTVRGRDRNDRCLQIIASIFARHEPDVLVLQDTSVGGTRRSKRVTNLNAAIFKLAELNDIPVRTYSRASVRLAFSYLERRASRPLPRRLRSTFQHSSAMYRCHESPG